MFNRIKSDKANGIAVLSLAAIIMIALMGSIVMDFGKNVQLKNAYENAAQMAAQNGIRHIHPHGGLKKEALIEAVNSYYDRRYDVVGTSSFGSDPSGKAYDIRVRACTDGDRCTKWSRKFTHYAGGNRPRVPQNVVSANFLNQKYTTIELMINEYSKNQLMGLIGKEYRTQTIPIKVEARTHYD